MEIAIDRRCVVMKERFMHSKPGDILLSGSDDKTFVYIIVYDGEWKLICFGCGGVAFHSETKENLYEMVANTIVDIIPQAILLNQINLRLGSKYQNPIIPHENTLHMNVAK